MLVLKLKVLTTFFGLKKSLVLSSSPRMRFYTCGADPPGSASGSPFRPGSSSFRSRETSRRRVCRKSRTRRIHPGDHRSVWQDIHPAELESKDAAGIPQTLSAGHRQAPEVGHAERREYRLL